MEIVDISSEIIYNIYSFLEGEDMINFSLTNKKHRYDLINSGLKGKIHLHKKEFYLFLDKHSLTLPGQLFCVYISDNTLPTRIIGRGYVSSRLYDGMIALVIRNKIYGLRLRGNEITNKITEAVSNSKLHSLSLDKFNDDILEILPKTNIKKLSLEYGNITEQGMLSIVKSNVTDLKLYKISLTHQIITILSKSNIKNLRLFETGLDDKMIEILSENKKIKILDLTANKNITNKSGKILSKLNLFSLDLFAVEINDKFMSYFIGKNIHELSLRNTDITDKSGLILSEMKIRKLNLSNTKITDVTVFLISKYSNIYDLNISRTNISDASLIALSTSSLKILDISETSISKNGYMIFEKSNIINLNICGNELYDEILEKIIESKVREIKLESECYVPNKFFKRFEENNIEIEWF